MKKPVLLLLTLLALAPIAQLMAQAPPAAPLPANGAAAAPAPDLAKFLATLSGQTNALSDLMPAPSSRSSCTSSSQCPTGQLCCMLCGNPPDDGSCMFCVIPERGRCPMVI